MHILMVHKTCLLGVIMLQQAHVKLVGVCVCVHLNAKVN